jgi:hypothetical protein
MIQNYKLLLEVFNKQKTTKVPSGYVFCPVGLHEVCT